jgi:hypothetical protein
MSDNQFTVAMTAIVALAAVAIVIGNATWAGVVIGISVLVIVVVGLVVAAFT